MKSFIVLTLLGASMATFIDFNNVKPRHLEKELQFNPPRPPIQNRIANGQAAAAKQIPYQVGLSLRFPDGTYWCGGTLISNRWILTAAHCTHGVEEITIILGGLHSTPNGNEGEQVITLTATAQNVIVHETYDQANIVNDVSLIRLPEAVTFNDYIRAAKLPKFEGTAPLYTGKLGIASGWGLVSDSSSGISPTLQYTDVPVMKNAECSVYYGRIPGSNLCISTEDTKKSTCSGDSGGPLILDGTDTLIGVTSFGLIYGCEYEYPAGFSRVTWFLDWIEKNSGVKPE